MNNNVNGCTPGFNLVAFANPQLAAGASLQGAVLKIFLIDPSLCC